MKKMLLTFTTLLAFSFGTTFAQDVVTPLERPADAYWAGLSTGFPFGVTLHFGIDDVFASNADVRFIGSIFGDSVGLGVDALYGFGLDDEQTLDLYVGGGPLLEVGNRFALGVNAFVGLEYRLSAIGFAPGGIFLEAGPFVGFGDETFVDFNARLGFNYHF